MNQMAAWGMLVKFGSPNLSVILEDFLGAVLKPG